MKLEHDERWTLATRRLAWAEWWARNAAETPLTDQQRPHFFRFALAALIASDVPTLHRELASLAQRETDAEGKIATARGIAACIVANEMGLARPPWLDWDESPVNANRPRHNPYPLAQCLPALVDHWRAVVPELQGLQGVVRPPAMGSQTDHGIPDGSPGNSPQSAADTSSDANT